MQGADVHGQGRDLIHRAKLGHDLLLLLHDDVQGVDLLVHIAIAQANIDIDIHAGIPNARINLNPLVTQTHHAGLVLVGGHEIQNTLKELLHALGQDPSLQLKP